MTTRDIAQIRAWHRAAALRAKRAGFDIVYVYAGHGYLPAQFLSPVHNQRTDEYGGSFENRARLIRELLEDTKEAVGDQCAVALRFSVDNLDTDAGITFEGEGRDLVGYLAEVPDLWDVNIANFSADSRTSRFAAEGAQERYVSFVKQLTTKPVVGVGRFTSADTMVSQVRRGVLDMIGAARPSIADPFLPRKIEEGRVDDVRECIGCNMCVGANGHAVPLHCTQNPTRGEEWRRGWHPENVPGKHADESILVVGAGPAGLEAARVLGLRGYAVTLAEATKELGGRVPRESRLPGLAEWVRVRDYRTYQLGKMTNVEVYVDSRLDAGQVIEFAFDHVCVAVGSSWRLDGTGRSSFTAIRGWDSPRVVGVEHVMSGGDIAPGPVVVYDDDHFYMGGVIAELLKKRGHDVTLVTSSGTVSPQTFATLEQGRIQARITELGIRIVVSQQVTALEDGEAVLECVYSGRESRLACTTLVPVTSRAPDEGLYLELLSREGELTAAGVKSLLRIGDCAAPGPIEAAVFAGHRYARELGTEPAHPARDRVRL